MTSRTAIVIATLLIAVTGQQHEVWAQYSPLSKSAHVPSSGGVSAMAGSLPAGEWRDVPRPPRPIGHDPEVTGSINATPQFTSLRPEVRPELSPAKDLPPQFRRRLVDYRTSEPVGTIIIDTPNTYLYLILGNGKAIRYGIGVGREGFTWSGTERISRMAEWPDWNPPAEMIERQPYLPRFMAGGEGNPLGARALYLGKSLYRIHGTNQPSTIGTFVSSGCIRLINQDIIDLYSRVQVGTRVLVLPGQPRASATTPPQKPIGEARPVPLADVPITTLSRPSAQR
jgi:lipoprotein-anchoring transpeptidase ErfK/SrfK